MATNMFLSPKSWDIATIMAICPPISQNYATMPPKIPSIAFVQFLHVLGKNNTFRFLLQGGAKLVDITPISLLAVL